MSHLLSHPFFPQALFTVYPTPVRGNAEKVAIFGDFGLRNDKCMADLVAEAAKGSFDSGACERARTRGVGGRACPPPPASLPVLSFSFLLVVHVGDFAYDMEEGNSTVGNAFMSLMQGYGATKVRRAGGGVRAKSERAARTF